MFDKETAKEHYRCTRATFIKNTLEGKGRRKMGKGGKLGWARQRCAIILLRGIKKERKGWVKKRKYLNLGRQILFQQWKLSIQNSLQ